MQLFKHTIVIARPRDVVFDFFTNWEKAPSWRQYVSSMVPLDAGPPKPGSRVHITLDIGGDAVEYVLVVLACERPALWRHRTEESNFTGHVEYRFSAEGGSTRVTFVCVAKPKTTLGWLAVPQLWLGRNRSYREQLPALKRAVEGE